MSTQMHHAIFTFPPKSVPTSKCKAVSLKHGRSVGNFSILIGTQVPKTKALQLNDLNIINDICRAQTQDCSHTSLVRETDHVASEALKKAIAYIRRILSTVEDGRISISPYDTAWVSLIENIDGSGTPQFPSSLEWIAQNQLSDGSWGDALFSVCDRLLNTLACVIALRSWNNHPDKSEKGTRFFKENLSKLGKEDLDSMTCGFEVVFPPLVERARSLGIEIPHDAPFLREIFRLRSLKFARIPKDLMHEIPTPILYNLEGLEDLNWEKLLKLQTEEGSFLTSPSSTAFALMQTKDNNCLKYLNVIITKFNGGAPTVYPIDVFSRLWAVDRLQRLGISRFFKLEIKDCLDYVYRYWTENGVFSGRNARVYDLDDTSMGFRLLRLLGYNVNPDVFKHFRKQGKFVCLGGELNESPTTILNLYKASQVQFPSENILDEAKRFSYNFLKERVANNKFVDKWVISKDIPGEITYGIGIPWYANLPRVEARFYVEHYSGADDVWVGKTLYRVAEISNNIYLELAKLDYNECQAQHQLEWINMQQWWAESNLPEFGISIENLLDAYFLAAASLYEPERSIERLAWAKSTVIAQSLTIYFDEVATSTEQRNRFIAGFKGNSFSSLEKIDKMGERLLRNIQKFIHHLSVQTFQGLERDLTQQLNDAWEAWLTTALNMKMGEYPNEATLIVQILNLSSGRIMCSKEMLYNDDYKHLSHLTDKVCNQFRQHQKNQKEIHTVCPEMNGGSHGCIRSTEIEADMQEIVRLVLQSPPENVCQMVKQTFLTVAKAFYYMAHCSKETRSSHISKVLFERLL
nr:copal-8-ol diphosphate hydratase, chloroplastic-like isoform X1 [Coffea arabica]